MSTSTVPTQKLLVERVLDWSLVQSRLSRYSAIETSFPFAMLRAGSSTGPYFCHYMAWRLGTWRDDRLVQRIDDLLRHAQSLPNWHHERSLLGGHDFGTFWSLVWQLQVAEFLSAQGSAVSWLKSGPDLSVVVNNQKLFVECYVYHKAFDVELFIEELLLLLGSDLRVRRDSHLKLAFSQGEQLTKELSELLSPLLSASLLEDARRRAQVRYPVVLSQTKDCRLHLYVEGLSPEVFDPAALPSNSGNPEESIDVALRESVSAKSQSNALGTHHPNLLLVNYLLSSDAQCSLSFATAQGRPLLAPPRGENIDAVAFSTAGIDSKLQRSNFVLIAPGVPSHPCHAIVSDAA